MAPFGLCTKTWWLQRLSVVRGTVTVGLQYVVKIFVLILAFVTGMNVSIEGIYSVMERTLECIFKAAVCVGFVCLCPYTGVMCSVTVRL